MNINRNDPCHCGSGKKYKKCCMEKDRVRERAQSARSEPEEQNPPADYGKALKPLDLEESHPPSKPAKAKKPNPHAEALTARWEEFQEQDYEGQVALFLKTLEEPQLMDDEMAFEMLNTLHPQTVEHREYQRYESLVEQLRERLPKIYDESAHYYLKNLLTNAVITGRLDRIPVLMNELTPRAYKDIDIFNKVVDQLAYHGQLSVLREALESAWPAVKKSPHIVPWGVEEFAIKTVKFLIFDYLEQHGADASGRSKLFKRLASYSEIVPERIANTMALIAGQAGRQWTREDFTFPPKLKSRDDGGKAISLPETVQDNLFDLSVDFQGHLWREEKVPLVKSELAREELVVYLVERLAGELEPRKSMFEAVVHPRRPGPPKRSPTFYLSGDDDSVHWLCPDRTTLDAFLAQLLDFLSVFPYKVSALYEAIPSWLGFLESRQLISASARSQTLRDLHGLKSGLLSILRKVQSDPALLSAIENWEKETSPRGS